MEFFNKKKDVKIQTRVDHEIPNHQVLLAFNGDIQAEAFCDWWHEIGIKAFDIWTKANGENYS